MRTEYDPVWLIDVELAAVLTHLLATTAAQATMRQNGGIQRGQSAGGHVSCTGPSAAWSRSIGLMTFIRKMAQSRGQTMNRKCSGEHGTTSLYQFTEPRRS